MSVEQPRSSGLALSEDRGLNINLQDQLLNSIMDVRRGARNRIPQRIQLMEAGRKQDYYNRGSYNYSQGGGHGHGGRMYRYFTWESLFMLVCLTASLLILPLVLPPLPPPPFLLLLLPIFILGLLMILAFMPYSSYVRDATYTYV